MSAKYTFRVTICEDMHEISWSQETNELTVNLCISCLSSDSSPCLDVDLYSRFGREREPEHHDVDMNLAYV
jgi:hypothetical protein